MRIAGHDGVYRRRFKTLRRKILHSVTMEIRIGGIVRFYNFFPPRYYKTDGVSVKKSKKKNVFEFGFTFFSTISESI